MNTKRATFGLVLIALGLLLVLRSTGIFSIGEMSRYLVPFLFISLGVWMIIRRKRLDDSAPARDSAPPPPPPPGDPQPQPFSDARPAYQTPPSGFSTDSGAGGAPEQPKVIYSPFQCKSDGRLSYSKALGDMFVDLGGLSVQNVTVSAMFGDIEIKLHGCVPADGLNRLVISGFIGDLRILVPRDLEIFAHCSNFIGDIDLLGKRETGFGNNMDAQTAGYNSAQKRLYIAANNFIGDIRILLV